MKKFLLMLILFFICGFISADLCMEQLQNSHVLLHLDIYESYANAELALKEIFWNIFYERCKLCFIIFLFMFTPIREQLTVILSSIFAFLFGFFFMSSIVELGIAGFIVAFAAVLPHGLLYAGVIALLLHKRQMRAFYQKDQMFMHIGTYLFILLLLITGCVLEGLVSVHFIPWVIRLSLI